MKTFNKALILWGIGILGGTLLATASFADYSGGQRSHMGWGMNVNINGMWMFGQYANNITKAVSNTASGVQIAYTTTDSGTLNYLQAFNFQDSFARFGTGITVSKANLSNGVQVSVSSIDAATITKLQEIANHTGSGSLWGSGARWMDEMHGSGSLWGSGSHIREEMHGSGSIDSKGNPAFSQFAQYQRNITKTATGITNGEQISFTTTDPATLTFLQGFSFSNLYSRFGTAVSVSQTNLANGVQVTVTSTDPAIVAQIQKVANNMEDHHGRMTGKPKMHSKGKKENGNKDKGIATAEKNPKAKMALAKKMGRRK